MMGNADILLSAQRMLGREADGFTAVISELAVKGIEEHVLTRRPWPCGLGDGESPGLWCGLSGIGYFYLRLYDPSVQSVLSI